MGYYYYYYRFIDDQNLIKHLKRHCPKIFISTCTNTCLQSVLNKFVIHTYDFERIWFDFYEAILFGPIWALYTSLPTTKLYLGSFHMTWTLFAKYSCTVSVNNPQNNVVTCKHDLFFFSETPSSCSHPYPS